jgi:streptomycin 3"-adenylyltransferase
VKPDRGQLDALVTGVQEIFGDDLIAVYLGGSAALGCFGPRSDLDVLVAIERPSSAEAQRRLGALCLDLSQRRGRPAPPHLIELDVVVGPSLASWRYPPPLDFHYSESLREAFGRGDEKPWRVDTYTDLACALTILNDAGVLLFGEPVAGVLPSVPLEDYRAAIRVDRQWCLDNLETFTLHVVLSLPRVWAGLEKDGVHSKASAAEWALPQLPEALQPVLDHALAVYRGDKQEAWDGLPIGDYVAHLVAKIPAT